MNAQLQNILGGVLPLLLTDRTPAPFTDPVVQFQRESIRQTIANAEHIAAFLEKHLTSFAGLQFQALCTIGEIHFDAYVNPPVVEVASRFPGHWSINREAWMAPSTSGTRDWVAQRGGIALRIRGAACCQVTPPDDESAIF